MVEETSFTVNLSTNDDLRAARAKLAEAVRRFATKVVGKEVRGVVLTGCFTRLSFAEWLTKHVSMLVFQKPEETRTQAAILSNVRRQHGMAVEDFIDENLRLIGELKFGG